MKDDIDRNREIAFFAATPKTSTSGATFSSTLRPLIKAVA